MHVGFFTKKEEIFKSLWPFSSQETVVCSKLSRKHPFGVCLCIAHIILSIHIVTAFDVMSLW